MSDVRYIYGSTRSIRRPASPYFMLNGKSLGWRGSAQSNKVALSSQLYLNANNNYSCWNILLIDTLEIKSLEDSLQLLDREVVQFDLALA